MTDIPYLNLTGEDIDPPRDHVFYINFPAEWKTTDLLQLFSPSFGPVQVTWIDDTSAFVSLKEHVENAKLVMSTLNCSSIYSILPYSQYKKYEGEQTENQTNVSLIKERHTPITVNTSHGSDQTTGITPMVEKNISFAQLINSTPQDNFSTTVESESSISMSAGSGTAHADTVEKHPALITRQISKGVKRSASPLQVDKKKRYDGLSSEGRKRNRSGDGDQKASKTFQEPSDWE